MESQSSQSGKKIHMMKAMVKITVERVITSALLPNLSTNNPKNGLEHADIIYGIPKKFPAFALEKPNLTCII